GQRPLVVVRDEVLDQPTHPGRVGARIQVAPPDELPRLVGHGRDSIHASPSGSRPAPDRCPQTTKPRPRREGPDPPLWTTAGPSTDVVTTCRRTVPPRQFRGSGTVAAGAGGERAEGRRAAAVDG